MYLASVAQAISGCDADTEGSINVKLPGMSSPESTTLETLRRILKHPDRFQLGAQLVEIVEGRVYVQEGITVRPGDVVLDVGANVGVAAAFFATECRAGIVHSFEPVAPVFEVLRENLRHFPACRAHPYGISSASGEATITWYPANWVISGAAADPRTDRRIVRQILLNLGAAEEDLDEALTGRFENQVLPCEMRTLTDVIQQESIRRIDLLKVDVEGGELEVLASIDDPYWPLIRQVAAEIHLSEQGRNEIVALLKRRGFGVTVTQEPVMRGTPLHMLYARRP
jgi:31-O-methyltransferase